VESHLPPTDRPAGVGLVLPLSAATVMSIYLRLEEGHEVRVHSFCRHRLLAGVVANHLAVFSNSYVDLRAEHIHHKAIVPSESQVRLRLIVPMSPLDASRRADSYR
jgi:hypothetical protein